MSLLKDLVKNTIVKPRLKTAGNRMMANQLRVLKKLLLKAGDTEYGKTYDFSKILFSDDVIKQFQEKVPITDYSGMHPWWQRAYEGEKNITWPGKVKYFALSSGTSEGSSKFIPVTTDALRAIRRTSMRQIMSIARSNQIPKDRLIKDSLMVGGSTQLNFNGNNYSGDLSGITTGNVPFWFKYFSKPGDEILSMTNWADKLDAMVKEAPNWDVSMVAGVPAWIQILFERIITTYNLKNIHDIWPNLSVYVWGGVSIDPYKKSLDALVGQPLKYFETYLASEGFLAYQSRLKDRGMKLSTSRIFFEFVPFDDEHFDENGNIRPGAKALTLNQVALNTDYAILISTNSGAFRYQIGDTVRFLSLTSYRIRITGRTKHFLSLCGEHLSVDNMTRGLQAAVESEGIVANEFTVVGVATPGRFAHQWYVGSDRPFNENELAACLDQKLKELNDDYRVERNHGLKEVKLKRLPNEVFNAFLASRGKQGGQTKFPRVLKGKIAEDWDLFIKKMGY